MSKKTVVRYLLIGTGIISLVLGVAGIFIPLLPTTPFLLLTTACFVRSSKRLHHWLINHRWFGTYIRNYRVYQAVPLKTKIITLGLLWLTIGYSALAVVDLIWVRILLFCIAAGVTIHLLRFKTLTTAMLSGTQQAENQTGNDEESQP